MEELKKSYLVGEFVTALVTDIQDYTANTNFSCCPVIAYTSGKNTVLARFTGQIGLTNIQEFQQVFNSIMGSNASKIIADMQHAQLTKAAVGALISFAAACFGLQKRLYIFNPSEQISKTLVDNALADYFTYLHTFEDIIATLKV